MFSKQSGNSELFPGLCLFLVWIFRWESITFGGGKKYIHRRNSEQILVYSVIKTKWNDIVHLGTRFLPSDQTKTSLFLEEWIFLRNWEPLMEAQFYIKLVFKPHFGTWILLFGPFLYHNESIYIFFQFRVGSFF